MKPEQLTDEQLRYFIKSVIESSPCMCDEEAKEELYHLERLPREELIKQTKQLQKYGHRLSEHLNLKVIRASLTTSKDLVNHS